MGRSNSHFEFSFPDRSPMRSSTLWTNPFLLLLTSIILAIGQWFLESLFWYITTISPILKFLLLPSHFRRSCKDCSYSFFQQNQNSLEMCWIRRQRFPLYISCLENSPGGGETTFDLMVRIFTGDKDFRLVGSLRTSGIQNNFYFCHYSQQRLIIQALPVCFQKWSQNGSCWVNLSLPNSARMTCQRRVLVPSNPVTTLF